MRADLAARAVLDDIRTLAPAVADWLRWKFRRYRIDRTDWARWERVLVNDLPCRVEAAGPPPAGCEGPSLGANEAAARGAVWTPEDSADDVRSKRHCPDPIKVPPKVRGKGYGRRGRPRTQPADDGELSGLMELYRQNQATVGPMLERCATDGDRLALLRAMRDYLADPNEPRAQARWLSMVRLLRST
ncbi:hypothetical protein [Sinisalibacter lacisalsi]|nr:hypothetical protein [Sinisalibacter lacisalsi]